MRKTKEEIDKIVDIEAMQKEIEDIETDLKFKKTWLETGVCG